MRILAHRGCWDQNTESNSEAALRLAIDQGFGFETDVRDHHGALVISHGPPKGKQYFVEELLQYYISKNEYAPIALNIKSDGLCRPLKDMLSRYQVYNYFVFDMSIPDTRSYLDDKLNVFTRLSDIERTPLFLDSVEGIWLDAFNTDWFKIDDILRYTKLGKTIVVVSPELHGRSHSSIWEMLGSAKSEIGDKIMICTDFPKEAEDFFNG